MKRNWLNNLIVLLLAIVISLLLKAVHMLLPFMFGPIIAALMRQAVQDGSQMAILD